MSYDLCFWRQDKPATEPRETYEKLAGNSPVSDVLELPTEEIFESLKITFADWECPDEHSFEKAGRAFQVHNSKYLFEFMCYGLSGEDMNKIIDVMLPFGCYLYDPQVGERFDG